MTTKNKWENIEGKGENKMMVKKDKKRKRNEL